MSQSSGITKNRGHVVTPIEADECSPSSPSKMQKKNDSRRKQSLGEKLVALSPGRLAKLALSDELRGAIELYLRLKDHSARKRQLQFIGRIIDPADMEGIKKSLEVVDRMVVAKKEASPAAHEATRRAEVLLREGDAALADIAGQLPPEILQALRQTVRNARKKWQAGGTEGIALQAIRDFILKHASATEQGICEGAPVTNSRRTITDPAKQT